MSTSHIEFFDPKALKPYKNNARTHSKEQITKIKASIDKFGFLNPILIDEGKTIIAGHGRIQAAIELGLQSVPTRCISHLSKDEKRAYILADNKLAEQAGWDEEILAIEFQHLLSVNDEVSISLTGFEMPEIDMTLLGDQNKIENETDRLIELSKDVLTKTGDVWLLGEHKILCADALEGNSFEKLMSNEKAQMVFSDPPYNVPVNGHICGKGKTRHKEFSMASGEMSEKEFTDFLKSVFDNFIRFSQDGSLHYICMDWRHISEVLSASKTIYAELKNLCVWNKNNGGMGSLYRSKHELVFVFKNGVAEHINNIELGKNGRYRTNVWDYEGVNGKAELLAMHPTVKPTAMIADAILDCTHHGDIILDCFGGSGSTLLAAERTRRHARLIEIDPQYVDITIQRWQAETGNHAIHQETGETFNEILAQLGGKHVR